MAAASTAKPSSTKSEQKKSRPLSKQQRKRQRKGVAKAEISQAKLAKKRRDSCVKAMSIKNRRVTWDELNEELRKSENTTAASELHSQATTTSKGTDKTGHIETDLNVSDYGERATAAKETRHSSDEDIIE